LEILTDIDEDNKREKQEAPISTNNEQSIKTMNIKKQDENVNKGGIKLSRTKSRDKKGLTRATTSAVFDDKEMNKSIYESNFCLFEEDKMEDFKSNDYKLGMKNYMNSYAVKVDIPGFYI